MKAVRHEMALRERFIQRELNPVPLGMLRQSFRPTTAISFTHFHQDWRPGAKSTSNVLFSRRQRQTFVDLVRVVSTSTRMEVERRFESSLVLVNFPIQCHKWFLLLGVQTLSLFSPDHYFFVTRNSFNVQNQVQSEIDLFSKSEKLKT